ncbi:serine hydrolase [Chitinophaga deserti]|uniref:serine hydrolase n=1 Tax=Chitinophaga deserti TaxID=2164099 RepID=UPI000D6C536D|nr:serine hydrolase [Chitinophaga deserti]
MKHFLSLIFSVLVLEAAGQQRTETFLRDSLDNYIIKAMEEWKIPGVSVAVVKDGKTVLMKAYGVREMGKPEKVDTNTMFMIGSNSKAFTATALAQLQADGNLQLDDPVRKYLPQFKLHDAWVAEHAIIRDLLSHRLGFHTFQGDFMFFDTDLTSAQVLEKLGRLEPSFGFRTTWGYCNAGFLAAGEIIPRVTGKTWAEFLKERIFEPLGMRNTIALSADIPKVKNIAAAHSVFLGELRKVPYGMIDNLAPAGSIGSSVADMTHWVKALLSNGYYEGKEILSKDAIAETRLPHSSLGEWGHPFNRRQFSLYGLGWFTFSYDGRLIVEHQGGVNGFVTAVRLLPEENLGIVVLTNTESNNFYNDLTNELTDVFLQLPFRNYTSASLSDDRENTQHIKASLEKINKEIAAKPKLPVPLTAFAGNYEHPVYGKMSIRLEKDTLKMRFEHHRSLIGTLLPHKTDQFVCFYNIPMYGIKETSFTIEKDKVASVTVRVAGFVESTPYVFRKLN